MSPPAPPPPSTASPQRLRPVSFLRSLPSVRSFDRIARPYRWLEWLTFGHALTRARESFLPRLNPCHRALVLGDGDGRFLAALLRVNPHLHATAVDGSAAMLSLLAARCRFAGDRLRTVHTDLLAALFPPTPPSLSGPFDLVVTHFVLDCFTPAQLGQLLPTVTGRLSPGALWVVSDFRIPPRGPLNLIGSLLVRSLYLAFRVLTGLRVGHLPHFAAALAAAGLVRQDRHLHLAGLLTAELWQLPASKGETASPGGSPVKPDHAPIETVYDIDPLTLVPRPPNPLPADLERDLLDRTAQTEAQPDPPAEPPFPTDTPTR